MSDLREQIAELVDAEPTSMLVDDIVALCRDAAVKRLLAPMECGHARANWVQSEHQWTGCRRGGDPAEAGSYEYVRYCKVCGMEDTCEDPLPHCEHCSICAELERDRQAAKQRENAAVAAALEKAAQTLLDMAERRRGVSSSPDIVLSNAAQEVRSLIPPAQSDALEQYVSEQLKKVEDSAVNTIVDSSVDIISKRVDVLVQQRTEKMRAALVTYNVAADKFIAKCEDGRAHSKETQADLQACRERARAILSDG